MGAVSARRRAPDLVDFDVTGGSGLVGMSNLGVTREQLQRAVDGSAQKIGRHFPAERRQDGLMYPHALDVVSISPRSGATVQSELATIPT